MPACLKLITTKSLLYIKYYKCKKFVVFCTAHLLLSCV